MGRFKTRDWLVAVIFGTVLFLCIFVSVYILVR